jgi:hypothetical protein
MDPPEERMAWDRDGSVLSSITSGGSVSALPIDVRQALNSESETPPSLFPTPQYLAVVFPLPMNMKAVFFAMAAGSGLYTVQTSKDTTNGMDGIWTNQLTGITPSPQTKPNYRMDTYVKLLQPTSISSDVKGIRIFPATGSIGQIRSYHLYGYPAGSATTDRLALWHPTDNNRLPAGWFDWGDTPRSSSADRKFRIKNLSSAKTANDIDIYIEALTPGNPSVAGMHSLSNNAGSTFQGALNLPVLNPGQVSGELILRRTVPANAQVSTWSARLAADVDNWS